MLQQKVMDNQDEGKKQPLGRPAIGRSKLNRIPVSDEVNAACEVLATKFGLTNPRTGSGNRSALIERLIIALSHRYPNNFPEQNQLAAWLLKIANASDIPDSYRIEAEQWRQYVETWAIDATLEEALAEGVIKTEEGSWIV